MFNFADEYTSFKTNSGSKTNCDVAGCPKWADLMPHFPRVGCVPNWCSDGDYYAPQDNSVMKIIQGRPTFNLVHERVACCKYLLEG